MVSKNSGNFPQFHAEISQFLADLGLTEYEAKTLSTLFKLKETEAPEISRVAQVPKTRVYDVLDRLTKKGLVIEIFGRPKKYRVVEPKEALDVLVKRKKEEVKALEEKSSELKALAEGFEDVEEEEGEKVMKVKDKQDFNRILAQEIGNAKDSVVAFSKMDEGNDALKEA
ncbi:MAG: helix-turn-helix domain-containing protein, partial [Candidatus Diapherotrites archaeon]